MTLEHYPTGLSLTEQGALTVEWSDDHRQELSATLLRRQCPCANCMEKRVAMLSENQVKENGPMFPIVSPELDEIRIDKMEPVGNYAYRIEFSDRHSAGVYTLEYLRSLG